MQTPYFLAAMPQLADPEFSKAVVLVTRHDETGAFGLIINAAQMDENLESAVITAELVDSDGAVINELEQALMHGGPVQSESIFILHRNELLGTPTNLISEKLYFESDPEVFQKILAEESLRKECRFYLGCSSWSAGQLDSELHNGSWLPVNFSDSFVFQLLPEKQEQLLEWKEAIWKNVISFGGANPLTLMGSGGNSPAGVN